MRRALAAAFAATMLVVGAGIAPATAAARPESTRATRLFMVSDSVGLGAIPAMQHAFAGWQVTVTGKPGLFTEMLVSYVNSAPASAFGDNAIVATGYNYPYWDAPRFDRSVDQMVAALTARGVRRIFWVTMREVTPTYYSHWSGLSAAYRTLYEAYPHTNDQLRRATQRHPELSIIDWAAIADQPGLSYDAIHLNPVGAAQYAALAYRVVSTAAARRAAGTVATVPVAGRHGVPADALAVSVNVTAINPRSFGAVTVYPCGAAVPAIANLLLRPGTTSANAAIVRVGAGGAICVRQSTDTHVVIDLEGAFGATSGFHRTAPRHVLDTRGGSRPAAGHTLVVHLGSLPGAPTPPFVAVLNATTNATADGSLRLFTCGTTPSTVATRTYTHGGREQVLQLVRTDSKGDVCARTTGSTHVTLDLFGWFDPTSHLRPLRTRRVLDTRNGAPLAAGVARSVQIGGLTYIPSAATGATVTLTLTSPGQLGTATVYPCALGGAATTVVNVLPNHPEANTVLASLDGSGRICVRSSVATHATLDVSGWTGDAFSRLRAVRVLDTRV